MMDPIDHVGAVDRLLVALDFDGTLAPFNAVPLASRATPEAKRAVARLAASPGVTVAFVSGRSLVDLRVIAEHDDDSPVWLIGSHGAEHWRPAGAPDPLGTDGIPPADADAIADDVAELTSRFEGAWIEPKRFGFALHTRTAAEGVEPVVQDALDELMTKRAPGWRRRVGKHILEFAWRHEGKDTAIGELRQATRADAVVFAGDDVTDEDALRALGPDDLGIRVGAGETAARLIVADTLELAEVLERLVERRASRRG